MIDLTPILMLKLFTVTAVTGLAYLGIVGGLLWCIDRGK
jgi:hypothetical protein